MPLVAVLELLPKQLDAQLQADEALTHFDYFVLTMLTLTEGHTRRMSALASASNSTLPRLSHVVARLEQRGYVQRQTAPDDARATDVVLTNDGHRKVLYATPGHVENVRRYVLDALTPEQSAQLREIAQAILRRLDPEAKMLATAAGDAVPGLRDASRNHRP
ncbi:hypothetical protein GCM10022287_16820 [Gryllotalpicola koreensis]|uniref:HTH marR-type domain-containing protein n=1 Tax=Gryllotalpicola koreensis TaxID=993086 RepID=A0ABP7ZZ12_9MICO